MLAYLVIREGTKWTDVFRPVPGQSVTIGRAPTNQIILKDDGHAAAPGLRARLHQAGLIG